MTKTATAHERPILTVDVALLALIDQRLHVALAPRAAAPFKGQLALPGGYVRVDADADTDQTARRVLREKLGFEPAHLEQACTESGPRAIRAAGPRRWCTWRCMPPTRCNRWRTTAASRCTISRRCRRWRSTTTA